MKKNRYDPPPLTLTEGYFSDLAYDSYEMLAESIHNWRQLCPYQLHPDGLNGRHKVLQLHDMQIVFGQRKGGSMHNAGTAKDCITIAVVKNCDGKVCFGKMKLKAGDILFFDDSKPHNFITEDNIYFIAVTVRKSSLGSRWYALSKAIDCCIKDEDERFALKLHEIWERLTGSSSQQTDPKAFQKAEDEILETVMALLLEQTPALAKLTAGEKIALKIRDQVFGHMDGNISISSLAEQYEVSEQTLQNSFKSLFGFTPNIFLRLLKLNIARYELKQATPEEVSVSRIAQKWGFKHMGRFSAYYTELFGENPSETLRKGESEKENIEKSCVSRQEEMT